MVTEDRIEKALRKVAGLVSVDPSILPIFEKLENERDARLADKFALQRAKTLAAASPCQAPQKAIGASSLTL